MRNLDVAQAARRAGWNVLTFAYRGAWGSEGTFSIAHAIEDGEAALRFVRSDAAAREYGIDRSQMIVGGQSLGGYIAARLAARDRTQRQAAGGPVEGPPLISTILLDPWDISATARELQRSGQPGREDFVRGLGSVGHARGPVTPADLYDEVMRRGADWDLIALTVPMSQNAPFLMIDSVPYGGRNNPLLHEHSRSCWGRPPNGQACGGLYATQFITDHDFSDKRVELAVEVVTWLLSMEKPPTSWQSRCR